MNNYLTDSGIFFREISRRLNSNISDEESIQLFFNLALGCERLLKGILYDINPVYILTEPDFKHSIQTIYKNRIITEALGSKDLVNNPNDHVITFTNSLLRAQIVSKSVYNHKNVLFTISNYRDIIAHCELNLLEQGKMKEILQRDFYTMMKSFANELNIKQSHFLNQNHIKLSRLSRSLQTSLDKQLELLIEEHKEIGQTLQGNPGFKEDKQKITEEIFQKGNKEKVTCPACQNEAIVYLQNIMELDLQKKEEILIGYQVKKLKCQYCKLEINNPSILDKLGINDKKNHSNVSCIYCGQEILEGETCNHCNSAPLVNAI